MGNEDPDFWETRRPTSQGGWRQEQEGGIQSFAIATTARAKQGEGPCGDSPRRWSLHPTQESSWMYPLFLQQAEGLSEGIPH